MRIEYAESVGVYSLVVRLDVEQRANIFNQ